MVYYIYELAIAPSWITDYNLPASFTASERASVDFEDFGSSVLSVGVDEFFFRMLSIENGLVSIMQQCTATFDVLDSLLTNKCVLSLTAAPQYVQCMYFHIADARICVSCVLFIIRSC